MNVAVASPDSLVVKGVELPPGLVLSTGTAFRTGVRGGPTDLFVLLLGKKFPLPTGSPYTPGQRVVVEVTQTHPELVLRVAPGTPGAQAPAAESASATPSLAALVPHFLRQLGGNGNPVASAAASELVALLSNEAGAGAPMSRVATLLTRASAAGVPLSAGTQALAKLLIDLAAFEPSDVARLLRVLADDARVSTEAKVAHAVRAGRYQELLGAFDQSLKAQLGRLLADPRLRAFAESAGERPRFEAAVEQLVARLSARDLQNLRGLDHPYLFFEVPFAEGAPLRQAFVHVFRDRQSEAGDGESNDATVVLDLTTESLGPIWCTLRAQGRTCRCQLRAERRATQALLQQGAQALEAGLRDAGYEEARVEAASWRDPRIVETARWMRTLTGFDARI